MTAAAGRGGRAWVGPIGLLAALAYVPALLTARAVVAADTKQYLYLDPGRYLRGAASLWDPDQFGGWVTHQTIGYLWPMGPFHWLLDTLGVPTWAAQRLWLGTVLVLGGTGVWWCCRVLGLNRAGATAGAVLYQLSPYVLLYAPRTSVLLLPWAGLGWLVGLTVIAARRGGWRYPAGIALVVATIAGTNATAVVLVGLGPVLWLAWAVWGSREVPWRRALGAAGRIALLSLGTCAAWIVAIVVQARFGADVLAYSETVEAVSSTSLASEVLRGLGYWLFYGGDVTGAWNSASDPYLSSPVLIGLGFGLVLLAVGAAVAVRWSQRGFVALLLLVGTVVSVGAHPLADPTLYGRLLSESSRNTLVLALRSSTRALPLVLLALSLAIAAGITALGARLPSTSVLTAAIVVMLAGLNLPALWTGTYVDTLQRRPEDLPAWWPDLAAEIESLPPGTRVLELPGAEFAAYRWGTTNDAILPGLTARPTLTRDLLPLGSPALMDLLLALDDRFQTGTVDGPEIAVVARMLGVGAIVVRGDSAFERFRTPRPEPTEALYDEQPTGLGAPRPIGPPQPNLAAVAGLDEAALADARVGSPVAPVLLVGVVDPQPIVRTASPLAPVVVAGDGEGIVAAAAAGLVDGQRPVLAAAGMDRDDVRSSVADPGASLVVTDSNRVRAREWRGSQDTTGFTEDGSGGVLRPDEADARLPVFPSSGPASWTRAEQRGGATIRATAYGEPNAYLPEARPFRALDGDPATAWTVGRRGEVLGERLRVELGSPRELRELTIVQPLDPSANRWITSVIVRTDQGSAQVALDETSRTAAGQRVVLPGSAAGTTGFVELEVAATNVGRRASYAGVGPVGIAELGIGDVVLDEVVVLPTDLLDAAGAATFDRELAFVLTRLRHDPLDRWRDDEEPAMVRELDLATDRQLSVAGTARLSARAPDAVLDALVAPGSPAVRVTASSRLAGSPASWGRAAVDGDPATAWTTAFGVTDGAALSLRFASPVELTGLDLRVVNDGQHSVPTQLVVRNEAGESRTVDVAAPVHEVGTAPPVVPVSFPALAGTDLTVTVTASTPRTTVDRRYGDVVVLPVAIAELGLGSGVSGGVVAPVPPRFDSGCRTDLLQVDGMGQGVRVQGTTADLLAREALAIDWCDADAASLDLAAGTHSLRTTAGAVSGLDLDRVVLRSAPGGGPWVAGSVAGAVPPPPPGVVVDRSGRTEVSGTVEGGDGAFWLILGQGYNEGWRASVDGRDLGDPQLIDGGMNGWVVPAAPGSQPRAFRFTWTPQRWVTGGIVVAVASVLACLALLLVPVRRRRADSTWNPREAVAPAMVGVRGSGPPTGWQPALTATAALSVVAVLVLPLWLLPLVAATTLTAARIPRLRRLPAIGAVTCIGLVALFYLARQVISAPVPGFGWPSAFERAHAPALLAVVLVAADALVAALRPREAVHYPSPEPTSPEQR